MTIDELQKLVNKYDYWDMRVKSLECNYFADEIKLVYDNTEGYYVIYHLKKCYKSVFDHVKNYDKSIPAQEMSVGQVPYFLQDVDVSQKIEDDISFCVFKINLFPLYAEIWCRDVEIKKEKIEEYQ